MQVTPTTPVEPSTPPQSSRLAPIPRDALSRGSAVVCIPVFGAGELFAQCLRSVVSNTPPDVPVLVSDDASLDPACARLVEEVNAANPERPPVGYHRQPENVGFVHNVNDALRTLAPADVIVLNSDCVVARGWYEGMRRAAMSDTRVATVSTLTNNGTILSVPERNRPSPSLPQNWSLEDAAAAVRASSPVLHPALPAAVGHCVYIRRRALDLVGYFDEAFAPGYEEEVDFSQRCISQGLSHVLADDVLVLHHGGGSFSSAAAKLKETHHRLILSRYPYWDDWVAEVQEAQGTPLALSLSAARRALRGPSITIDGRILTEFMTGTQLHALEVIAGVHDAQPAEVRVIVPPRMGDYAADVLGDLERVRLVTEEEARREPATDVAHRPWQLSSFDDLRLLMAVGERLVITQQDLISFHNPAYHEGIADWQEHRSLTRLALAAADRVAFFSRHARSEALREQLVEPSRARVVLLGTDHRLTSLRPEPEPPLGAERVGERPFLLCLGTDFLHKNRVFAIRLLGALRDEHGWDGTLVLAGPKVAQGSSAGEEAAELARRPELADHVVDLAAVNEAGKRWLLERAAAVAYPTTSEGFGLVPFEAGEAGVPCLFAAETALGELLPADAALLEPWDASASARRCLPVLAESPTRDEHLAMLRAAGAMLTWRRTAHELKDLYADAIATSARDSRSLVADLAGLSSTARGLTTDGGRHAYAMALVGPDGALPPEMVRPLLAVSTRPLLRKLVFPPLRAMYSVMRLIGGKRDDAPERGA